MSFLDRLFSGRSVKFKDKSCCFLEYGGVHFISDSQIRPCCTLSDYSYPTLSALTQHCPSEYFDVENYKNLLNRIKKSNKTANPICKNCGYFQAQKWIKIDSDYLINHRIILSFHTLCNFRCDYCTIATDQYTKTPPNIMPILSDMINKRLVNPSAIVEFSGGEPALLSYHAELIDLFRGNGNRIIFITNASNYSQAIFDYLRESAGSYILTSLDAGTEKTFKQKRGVNAFEKVKKNIRIYSDNKNAYNQSQVALKYIFAENNLLEIDINNFIEFCVEINPFKVVLAMDFVTTLSDGIHPKKYTYQNIITKMQEVKETLLKKNIAVEMATYDSGSYGMFYPNGVVGDKRVFRTFLE